jgi:hypothetical protein
MTRTIRHALAFALLLAGASTAAATTWWPAGMMPPR